MKPTAEAEKEVLEVYHKYWNSYFNGDMKSFANQLDDGCSHCKFKETQFIITLPA